MKYISLQYWIYYLLFIIYYLLFIQKLENLKVACQACQACQPIRQYNYIIILLSYDSIRNKKQNKNKNML
jgi:hypothetical protein